MKTITSLPYFEAYCAVSFTFFFIFSGVDNYERMLTLVSSLFFPLFTHGGEGGEAKSLSSYLQCGGNLAMKNNCELGRDP